MSLKLFGAANCCPYDLSVRRDKTYYQEPNLPQQAPGAFADAVIAADRW
jgi:hypothetical protein